MAINIPIDQMMERQYEPIFRQRMKSNVFYADSDTLVRMACLKAKFIGKADNMIMKESARDFKRMFVQLEEPPAGASKSDLQTYHFRTVTARANGSSCKFS
jgi:hypothetical protein